MPSTEPREMVEQHLAEAEKAVTEGRVHIASQVQIIADLKRGDNDTAAAEALLRTLMETQRLHEEHRDRLRQELGLA
jgi:hypothetical protein